MVHDSFEVEIADPTAPFDPNAHYVLQVRQILESRVSRLSVLERLYQNHKKFQIVIGCVFTFSIICLGALLFDLFVNSSNYPISVALSSLVIILALTTGWLMARDTAYHSLARKGIYDSAEYMRQLTAYHWIEERYGLKVDEEEDVYEALFRADPNKKPNYVRFNSNSYMISIQVASKGFILCIPTEKEMPFAKELKINNS